MPSGHAAFSTTSGERDEADHHTQVDLGRRSRADACVAGRRRRSGLTGPEYSDCRGDRLSNGHGMTDNLFGFDGFTRNLRRFAGEDRVSSTNHHAWSLRGRG